MLKAGEKAPDFELKDQDGKTVRLSELKGKKVIVYFYPKDDTSGCTREAIGFTEAVSKIEAKNTVVLGISPDSADSHKKFENKYQLKLRLLADTEKKVIETYGVWQKKLMYGIPRMGLVRTTYLIDENGIVEQGWENVRVDGHVETVCSKL